MALLKPKIERIATFDLLRGYFLVGIIIDHLSFFPNGLDWWSARGGLFVSMAEGFFLISGIVLGIVRGAKLVDESFKVVAGFLLKRGVQLYITAVVLTLLFTFIGWLFYMNNPGLKPGIISPDTPVWQVIVDAITLEYFFGWADYLRLYAIFILISPLVMWLLRKGLWYVVFGASIIVWLLFPEPYSITYEERERLQYLSWQIIFFGGLIIGFYWPRLTAFWRSQALRIRKTLKVAIVAAAGITLSVSVLLMLTTMGVNLPIAGFNQDLWHRLFTDDFNKEALPILRIALFALWFAAAYILFRRFEKQIIRYMGWLLLPFGTNSLYVYTLHAIIIFFVHLYFQAGGLLYNFIISAVIIAVIWLMVRYQILFKIIPR